MILKIILNWSVPMPRIRPLILSAGAALVIAFAPILSVAAPQSMPEIRLEQGRFQPEQLVVPADNPFKLRVTNSSPAVIEFESFELHRERVLQPGETITVYMPPLRAGTYRFFDDFNHATPQGTIVAK
jgi:heme/copper-type cytochrome/quinol oxidase subunit 2